MHLWLKIFFYIKIAFWWSAFHSISNLQFGLWEEFQKFLIYMVWVKLVYSCLDPLCLLFWKSGITMAFFKDFGKLSPLMDWFIMNERCETSSNAASLSAHAGIWRALWFSYLEMTYGVVTFLVCDKTETESSFWRVVFLSKAPVNF